MMRTLDSRHVVEEKGDIYKSCLKCEAWRETRLASVNDDFTTTRATRPCVSSSRPRVDSSVIANLPSISTCPAAVKRKSGGQPCRPKSVRLSSQHLEDITLMLLPSLITLRYPVSHVPTPEDILDSIKGSIFTDDLLNQHGDNPDTIIVYKNARYGNLEFRTADINGEEQRRKFAHYLWNAGVLMGELVGGRPEAQAQADDDDEGWKNGEWWVSVEEEKKWSVRDESVLELGAGALG